MSDILEEVQSLQAEQYNRANYGTAHTLMLAANELTRLRADLCTSRAKAYEECAKIIYNAAYELQGTQEALHLLDLCAAIRQRAAAVAKGEKT